MRSYAALSGRENAFGWGRRRGDGTYDISIGGLKAESKCEWDDGTPFIPDAHGSWRGVRAEIPRFVRMEGRVILCDESVISWEEAALITYQPQSPIVQVHAEAEKRIVYRARVQGHAVDELPTVHWPRGMEQIKGCFEKGKPAYVLPFPWRFVEIPGTRGACLVGRLIENGRITKTAAAVRARGGLLQPKALQGYSYVQSARGDGYWMLIQPVR